jgi:nucleotide-binding universal stress UspA family protein
LRDLSPQVVVRPGYLCGVLSETVTEHGIDLLVAGVHGRSWLGKIMLGSAAEMIFRNVSCPVLTVGPHADGHTGGSGILRILFPTDLEHVPDRALSWTIAMANEHNAQVVFLHVLHRRGLPVDYPDEEDIDDERYVDAMTLMNKSIPSAADFRRDPEMVIESGVPSDCVVRVARNTGADLIAMSVRRVATATRVHIPWSTAYRIIAHATCPVLTVGE